jgi:FkbM family methyltransferase
MMHRILSLIDKFLGLLGLKVMRRESFTSIQQNALVGFHKLYWILKASPIASTFTDSELNEIISNSRSQLGQDVFALSFVGTQKPGFFVEFGATNGKSLSNTYLLEKHFGWTGILCEPAKTWLEDLRKNRSASIDTRCVYSRSDLKLRFWETDIGELSTIEGFGSDDEHSIAREGNHTYEVEAVSLLDLLDYHNAPKFIDFLSVDTEGSEFEILNAFDFSKYSFGAICVEHNYSDSREKVQALLLSNGYRQVYQELSDFDDWFVLSTNHNSLA